MLTEIRNRESPLVFDEKREVESEKLTLLIEAARWAPSCYNKQPWKYVFVGRKDAMRKAVEGALALGNGWAKKAAYIVVAGADPKEACESNGIQYYAYDLGLSVMSLAIEAEHLGLRTHQMAGWDGAKMAKAAGFPANCMVVVVFALGYETDAKKIWDKLEERIKDRLAQPRTRKPVNENFFFGRFGTG